MRKEEREISSPDCYSLSLPSSLSPELSFSLSLSLFFSLIATEVVFIARNSRLLLPNFSFFSLFLSLPLALSLETKIPSRGEAGGKAPLSSSSPLSLLSLSRFLLLSLFISSSPRSLSPSLLASSSFSRDGNFQSRVSFFTRPSISLSCSFLLPLPLLLSFSLSLLIVRSLSPKLFSLSLSRHPLLSSSPLCLLRAEDSSSCPPGIHRDQEREERMERRENGEIKNFSSCRFCKSDPRVDCSGLTRMLKERGHQINDQKCFRLKSQYLTILMELRAEISWA